MRFFPTKFSSFLSFSLSLSLSLSLSFFPICAVSFLNIFCLSLAAVGRWLVSHKEGEEYCTFLSGKEDLFLIDLTSIASSSSYFSFFLSFLSFFLSLSLFLSFSFFLSFFLSFSRFCFLLHQN